MSNSEKKILPSIDLLLEADNTVEISFAPFTITITIENTTAGTMVSNIPPIKILQFLDHGLILEVVEKSCAPGHMMAITFKCEGVADHLIEFQVTAKVETTDRFPDRTDQIKVKFIQYPEAPWDILNQFLKNRQQSIGNFLELAGGK